jgi:hypothetical protein
MDLTVLAVISFVILIAYFIPGVFVALKLDKRYGKEEWAQNLWEKGNFFALCGIFWPISPLLIIVVRYWKTDRPQKSL